MHSRIWKAIAVTVLLVTTTLTFTRDTRAESTGAGADTSKTTRTKPATGSASAPKRARERTIAPFPVPGDTSALSLLRWRTLNLPRNGITTVAPLPPPAGQTVPGAKPAPGASDTSAMSRRDILIRQRIAKHVLDCDDEYMDLPEPLYREDPVAPPGVPRGDPKRIIKVFAFIGEDGRVEVAETHEAPSPLDSAAVACVQRWRFNPAMHCGHALPVWVAVPLRFDSR